MDAKEIVKALREHAEWAQANEWECPITMGDVLRKAADTIEELNDFTSSQCSKLLAELGEAERRERAHEAAIKRHYADMTSQCFICYSCVNHDARSVAKWDGKKLEGFACSGCGKGKPKWQFDVDRFSREVAK